MRREQPKNRAGADPRPHSDVSSGVGLAGLFGLFAWIAICRNWPAIADAFALPGPREPLSGPYAALTALAFSSVPMVLWSLLVDKVHRRKSTGIDWKSPRPLGASLDVSTTKLAGLWATWAIIGFLYCIARWYWRGQYLFAMEVIGAAAVPLFVLSIPYVAWLDRYLVNPRDGAWHFGAMLIGREAYDVEEVKAHFRSWAVKGFFCAFMISILPPGFYGIVTLDLATLGSDPAQIAGWLIELLFLIDVQIAMVGYLLTIKPLDAQIRSANPYVAGWLAALICYPPFILMGDGGPLAYHQNTADWAYWMQGHTALLWAWGALLVVLTGVYAWATVIFGMRFSNLTYRGVITNGPYRFTRHPAYLSKNLFWWASTLPFIVTSHSLVDVVRNTFILGLVSAVYYWRARTEEKHLLAEDAKYRDYHAWMGRNAFITRGLGQLARRLRPRGPQLQPAE
jgi:protein-S-isoprenylcysteine O-methyltransferase Ste14